MRVPVQAIANGAWRVKILDVVHTDADGSPPHVRWYHEHCFAHAEAIQTRAMSVDHAGTKVILERIAAKQDAAAAVPSPLPSIRRPRAWLSLTAVRVTVHVAMTHAHHHPYIHSCTHTHTDTRTNTQTYV